MEDSLLTGMTEFKELNKKTGALFDSKVADRAQFAFSESEITWTPSNGLLQYVKQAERMHLLDRASDKCFILHSVTSACAFCLI